MLKCWLPWFYFFSAFFSYKKSLCFIHSFQDGLKFLGNIYNWLIKKFLLFHPFLFFCSFFIFLYTWKKRKIVYCYLLGEGIRNWVQNTENKRQKKAQSIAKMFSLLHKQETQLSNLLYRRHFVDISFILIIFVYCYSMLGQKVKIFFFKLSPRTRWKRERERLRRKWFDEQSMPSVLVDTPTLFYPTLFLPFERIVIQINDWLENVVTRVKFLISE
jgi:hypothetical protein